MPRRNPGRNSGMLVDIPGKIMILGICLSSYDRVQNTWHKKVNYKVKNAAGTASRQLPT